MGFNTGPNIKKQNFVLVFFALVQLKEIRFLPQQLNFLIPISLQPDVVDLYKF